MYIVYTNNEHGSSSATAMNSREEVLDAVMDINPDEALEEVAKEVSGLKNGGSVIFENGENTDYAEVFKVAGSHVLQAKPCDRIHNVF